MLTLETSTDLKREAHDRDQSTRNTSGPLLEIRGLSVQFPRLRGAPFAVRDAQLSLQPGECLGIVGESGSGKTQLLHAILGLSPPNARLAGSVRYCGRELLGLSAGELNQIRGRHIAMIFQDPMTALHPCLRIGAQICEVARLHRGANRHQARQRALQLLERVHIGDPQRCLHQYPHELSGGMRQRVMIAMALMGDPEVLLADEPTTALDVTVQAQILKLLQELQSHTGIAVVLVTHDMGVVAELADRVAVMYAGRIVESASAQTLFAEPRHPYSEALQRCIPRLDEPVPAQLVSIAGAPPDPAALPPGCAFAPRCAYRFARCDSQVPAPAEIFPGHWKACHYSGPLK